MRAFAISALSVSRPRTSESGQSRHFDRGPATSDLPPGTDIVSPGRHVSNLPKIEPAGMAASGAKRPFVALVQRMGVRTQCSPRRIMFGYRLAQGADRHTASFTKRAADHLRSRTSRPSLRHFCRMQNRTIKCRSSCPQMSRSTCRCLYQQPFGGAVSKASRLDFVIRSIVALARDMGIPPDFDHQPCRDGY
jgi:hypothetical protein